MTSTKPKVIAIVGPTASGKSRLALALAKTLHGEIISADSRQIYRGLEIGSNQPSQQALRAVPHHLIAVADPRRPWSAAVFATCAARVIKKVFSRKRIPIVVGGTGFWVEALLFGFTFPRVPPNRKLRKYLGKKNAPELFRLLQNLDPRRAKTIDPENPRRLIRAIEIARALGRVPKLERRIPQWDILWLGLNPNRKTLIRRVSTRARAMVRRGLLRETEQLLREGVPRQRIEEFGFEYRAALDVIDGKTSRHDLPRIITRRTIRYGNKQLAWWRRKPYIFWISNRNDAERRIKNFLLATSGKNQKDPQATRKTILRPRSRRQPHPLRYS